MKNKVLPFTCLKLHFEGEQFNAVPFNGKYSLESINAVLVGSNGNVYEFENETNALIWLDTNLTRASKNNATKQQHIDNLVIKQSQTPNDYLQNEIDILEARNAGDWGVYFYDELVQGFGVIAKGAKGDTGEQGLQGLQGEAGLNGADGAQGVQGVQGETGLQGVQGVQGEAGLNGADGAQGVQGVQGETGLQGVQGIQGEAGLNGADGAQGVQGVKGDTGEQGLQGVQGEAGLNGEDGGGLTWQYPIGYILIDAGNTNPFTFLGYGTWQAFGAGRVLVGLDATQAEFDTLGEIGGEKTHVLTIAEMPSHKHKFYNWSTVNGGGDSIGTSSGGVSGPYAIGQVAEGGGQKHNNLQPYIVVKFWKRTA